MNPTDQNSLLRREGSVNQQPPPGASDDLDRSTDTAPLSEVRSSLRTCALPDAEALLKTERPLREAQTTEVVVSLLDKIADGLGLSLAQKGNPSVRLLWTPGAVSAYHPISDTIDLESDATGAEITHELFHALREKFAPHSREMGKLTWQNEYAVHEFFAHLGSRYFASHLSKHFPELSPYDQMAEPLDVAMWKREGAIHRQNLQLCREQDREENARLLEEEKRIGLQYLRCHDACEAFEDKRFAILRAHFYGSCAAHLFIEMNPDWERQIGRLLALNSQRIYKIVFSEEVNEKFVAKGLSEAWCQAWKRPWPSERTTIPERISNLLSDVRGTVAGWYSTIREYLR